MPRDRDDEYDREERRNDDDRGRSRDARGSDRDPPRRGRDRDERDRDEPRGRSEDRGRDRGDGRDRDGGTERRTGSKSFEVKLNNVRISFESVFKKKKFGEDDPNPKYAATFLMDKERQRGLIDACWDAIDDAKYAEWGDKQPGIRDDKLALRDGDDEKYDGYEGMMYVAARSDRRPKVFDRDKSPLTEDDGVIYSGCIVNAVVRFWPQNNKWGKRINASLEGVQFVRDGEAFGPAPLSDDAFDDLGEDRDGGRDQDRGRSRPRDRDREEPRGRDRDRGREEPRDRDRGREEPRGRSRDDFAEDRGRDESRYDDDRPRGRGRDNVTDLDERRRDRGRDRDLV